MAELVETSVGNSVELNLKPMEILNTMISMMKSIERSFGAKSLRSIEKEKRQKGSVGFEPRSLSCFAL